MNTQGEAYTSGNFFGSFLFWKRNERKRANTNNPVDYLNRYSFVTMLVTVTFVLSFVLTKGQESRLDGL